MNVVIGDEEQAEDNVQRIQEPENARNKEIDPSNSGVINKGNYIFFFSITKKSISIIVPKYM